MHKNPGTGCYSCYVKLLECDERIKELVLNLQNVFPDCHVAVGYRDQAGQHTAFMGKLSTYDWPDSPHNYNVEGIPQSKAVDLFCLEPNGKASFLVKYYQNLWTWYSQNKSMFQGEFTWGGTYIHLKDFDHIEVKDWKTENG